jgi:predicted nuclease of predicted toxin-antitoxin system
MRFLANEKFPGDAVAALRSAGHEVAWVRIEAPGMNDADVLSWAAREGRVLLTFDKDFGELSWQAGLPNSCGIVLFRLPMPSPSAAGAKIAARLGERSDWFGHFSVIEPTRVRMRELRKEEASR